MPQVWTYWTFMTTIAGLLCLVAPSFALTVGKKAPDFISEDLSGHAVRLSDVWKNKVVILYFGDVRFRLCQQGLLELQTLRIQYPEKLTILAVNIDAQARPQMRSFLVSHPQAENIGKLLLDTGGGARRYDAEFSVPVSCVIDRKGRIAFYEQSFDIQKLRQVVSKLLSPQVPPARRHKFLPQRVGLWGQRLWPFEEMRRGEVFQHWGNGDVFSIALLREGRAQWTFGLMAFYHKNVREHYRENYIFMRENFTGSVTLLFGPPPLWHRVGVSFSTGGLAGRNKWGRVAEYDQTTRPRSYSDSVQPELHAPAKTPIYIVPVAGLSIRVYIIDAVSLYAFGEVDLKTAVERWGDILKRHHGYRYEAGIRVYITRWLNLNIGYGQWRVGGLSVNGIQTAYGFAF